MATLIIKKFKAAVGKTGTVIIGQGKKGILNA
jgi:hypothetical protein